MIPNFLHFLLLFHSLKHRFPSVMCVFYWSVSFFFPSTSQAIDAKTIKDVCTKYIFDKAPAVAAVGMLKKQKSKSKEHLAFSILLLGVRGATASIYCF